MNVERSPWWYRRRDAVFGMIYGIGFFGAWAFSAATHQPYRPWFVAIAQEWGSDGWTRVAAVMIGLMAASFILRLWGSQLSSHERRVER